MPVRPAIIPGMRYDNALEAIDFLCRAFGFTRHAVYADEADPSTIHHAELLFNGQMVMLGSARNDASRAKFGWRQPREAGGVTGSIYVVLDDPDAHAAVARAAGAELIDEPHDNEGYPGRGYSARDLEGYVWSFGSYDPWADAT